MVRFGGDTNQAEQFARSVPDFVLKGRFADVVRLDLAALEQERGCRRAEPRVMAADHAAVNRAGIDVRRSSLCRGGRARVSA